MLEIILEVKYQKTGPNSKIDNTEERNLRRDKQKASKLKHKKKKLF